MIQQPLPSFIEGSRHIIPISGKDSGATALVQLARNPDLPYEYLFNQTGAEYPEVLEWLEKMSKHLGKPITYLGEDLEDLIFTMGFLPSHHRRYCTKFSKIFPMENYIGGHETFVYYGLRADESRIGYRPSSSRQRITPVYPLQELGLGIEAVWSILEARDLLPPQFLWESVIEAVTTQLGEKASLIETLKPWEYSLLFSGRTRSNCYYCFYQKLYEWIWLLETHPEMFSHAVDIEENTGASNFYWYKGESLRSIASRAETIRKKRVNKICKILLERETISDYSLMSTTSCGVLCGK